MTAQQAINLARMALEHVVSGPPREALSHLLIAVIEQEKRLQALEKPRRGVDAATFLGLSDPMTPTTERSTKHDE